MQQILVYHNGECSKCQALTEILQQQAIPVTYKFYLHEPLTVEELQALLAKLQLPATGIIRTGEPLYATLLEGRQLTERELLQAIVDHPVLLQRPIVVVGDKAVIARPAENVLSLL